MNWFVYSASKAYFGEPFAPNWTPVLPRARGATFGDRRKRAIHGLVYPCYGSLRLVSDDLRCLARLEQRIDDLTRNPPFEHDHLQNINEPAISQVLWFKCLVPHLGVGIEDYGHVDLSEIVPSRLTDSHPNPSVAFAQCLCNHPSSRRNFYNCDGSFLRQTESPVRGELCTAFRGHSYKDIPRITAEENQKIFRPNSDDIQTIFRRFSGEKRRSRRPIRRGDFTGSAVSIQRPNTFFRGKNLSTRYKNK